MNWQKLKYLLPSVRRRAERDMQEELEALSALAEPGELGNLTLAAEDARGTWGWAWLTSVVADFRYGLRTLLRQRGFLAAAILTLALGVGANTTIFSVINATILKPLPFPDSGRLVLVWETFGKGSDNKSILSAPNFWDFQRRTHSFEAIAIFGSGGGYNLSAAGQETEPVFGLRVSASFFPVLGAHAMLGRTFTPEEELLSSCREVVLSYGLWQRRYGGDATIVGRTVKIDGDDFTVVGVMPRNFNWQFESGPLQLWVPVGYTKTDYVRSSNSFLSIARLKPGVTLAQARSEMVVVAGRLAKQYPNDDPGMSGTVEPLGDYGLESLRHTMLTLLAAVGFVLLIACVNVANLMLARGASRRKEFAVRRALGAGPWRIARQLLTESLLLAVLGGVAGVLVAIWSSRLLFRLLGPDMQLPMRQVDSISLDWHVLAFALLLSCLTGIVCGLVPVLNTLRSGVDEPLKEAGRGSTGSRSGRLRQVLVASEVALALVVLSGAGLMIKSAARLLSVDPGLKPENLLTMTISVPQEDTFTGPPGLPRFCQDLSNHVGTLPGVVSASAVSQLPFGGNASRGFQIEGRAPADPEHMPGADYSVACPGYFRTMGIAILKGREFTHQDTLRAPGAIVINEAMARKYWPKEDPIGKSIRLGGIEGPLLTIVGITANVHYRGLDEAVRSQFMRPYTQAAWPMMNIVVRTVHTPAAFAEPAGKAFREFLPGRPVSNFDTMEHIVQNSIGSRRVPMLLLSAFSVIALILAFVGIMGVVSYSVTQRTREIGLRIALGARATSVFSLVLGGSMKWVLAGLAFGLAGSAALSRVLGALLYEVRPNDPEILGIVSGLLVCVALLASFVPARRAANLDPIRTLRNE